MLSKDAVKVVLGAGTIGDASDSLVGFSTPEATQELFDAFRAYGGDEVDTAQGYSPHCPGTSEPIMGQTDVAKWAIIATKVKSRAGDHTRSNIEASVNQSLEFLRVPHVDIDYLHQPDPDTPFEETIGAMDAAYRAGKFKQFGISNYTVDQVRQVLTICEEKGYVKPVVYQGLYNAVSRKHEKELLPLLRQNGIRFYAYSPAAGGAFTANSSRLTGDNPIGELWRKLFGAPEVKEALKRIQDYGQEHNISGHEIAIRWILHHSALRREHGDAIIIGTRTMDQLHSTMKSCESGPLPEEVLKSVNEIGEAVLHVSPLYP